MSYRDALLPCWVAAWLMTLGRLNAWMGQTPMVYLRRNGPGRRAAIADPVPSNQLFKFLT